MNGYFWRTGDEVVHHIRAESIADVRDRIAATHGEEIAKRAVIKTVSARPTDKSEPSAA